MTDTSAVLTERTGQVGNVWLTALNRPEARNAINEDVARGLAVALDALDGDSTPAVGVVTGAGNGFSAGMDLKTFLAGVPAVERRGFAGIVERAADNPLIAAVEGFALAGGLEVALACDLLVAARGARLGIPETSVGLFAAAGALLHLPHRMPYAHAMELGLTADPISAERANELGLVNRLVEPGHAAGVAIQLADRIARNAPLGLAAARRALRGGVGRTEAEFWEFQTPLMTVYTSDDGREGAAAFAERRPPRWQGR